MTSPDFNLLIALHALLEEGGVAGAARRLHLSPSALSRALTRLRETTGDPLLVRAGRGLVPTPRALELRERVGRVVEDAHAILRPAERPDLSRVERTFVIATSEGFVENFGPDLIRRVAAEAPGVRLTFIQKTSRDTTHLREGSVDLETGVVRAVAGPEVRTQSLFRDRFVGVVREGHPLSKGRMTASRYAAAEHIGVSRRIADRGPIDEALHDLGLSRQIATTVAGFATALTLAAATDLVATVPERHTGKLRMGMHSFALPVAAPEITVSMLWHPRMHADPVHRWLRGCVQKAADPDQPSRRAGSRQ